MLRDGLLSLKLASSTLGAVRLQVDHVGCIMILGLVFRMWVL